MSSCTFLGDCNKLMLHYEDHFFEVAHVDPPYFSGPEKRQYYGKKVSTTKIKRRDYGVTDTWSVPNDTYFNEFFRVSKNQIICGANYFQFKDVLPFKTPRRKDIEQFINDHPTGWIIWDKCNGDTTFNDYELAWTSYNEPTFIYKFMWNGMMQGSSELNGDIMQGNKQLNQKRIHPTEKPIKLYRYITNRYAKSGDKILDTHLGSGSHRLACYSLDFDFYGMEINEIHFNNESKRFNQLTNQCKLAL